MNVVVIGNHKFVGPAGWEEITPRHFCQLLRWRVNLGNAPAGRWALLQLWYGIRHRHTHYLSDEQRADLSAVLDFIDTRPARWMLPRLRLRMRTYMGPGDGLEHLTFGEFMFAENARRRYQDSAAPADLSELVASLYRPRALFYQPAGFGLRQLFDQRKLEQQLSRLAILPVSVQQGVLMNYLGCLDAFPLTFPHLFKPAQVGAQEGGSWLDVGIGLARQTSALGTFQQMEGTNLYLVLTALDAIMKENAELKAKTNP